MRNYFTDVGEFHRKFDIPVYDPRKLCAIPPPEIVQYRIKFLKEELAEFEKAIAENDLVEALDAIADIVYVAMGTAHYFNAPFDQVWREIQRANMERIKVTRENCPPDKQYRPDLVIKPPGWKEPQIAKLLEIHNNFARRMVRRSI